MTDSDLDERLADLFDGPEDDEATLQALAVLRAGFPRIPSRFEYDDTDTVKVITLPVSSSRSAPAQVTLDGLAHDPAKAAALSPDECRALLVQMAAGLAALGATMGKSSDEDTY